MGFFKDMIAVFQKKELKFLEYRKEADDVYSFMFEKPNDLSWSAGQYGLFTITHKSLKNNTRPLSIASAPEENVIRITTRISDSPSDYKKALLELKQGMTIKMGGPIGKFSLDDSSPSLLIAGGIGITPFRSILKQLAGGGNSTRPIHLLYMDRHLFKDELNAMAEQGVLTVTYVSSRDALEQEIDQFAAQHKTSGNYYVAGPKSLVDSISSYMNKHNVPKQRVKKDAFFGY